MSCRCPSELSLEKHLLEERLSPVAPHVVACLPCRAHLDALRALGEEFRREVYPATVGQVVEAVPPPRSRWWLFSTRPRRTPSSWSGSPGTGMPSASASQPATSRGAHPGC